MSTGALLILSASLRGHGRVGLPPLHGRDTAPGGGREQRRAGSFAYLAALGLLLTGSTARAQPDAAAVPAAPDPAVAAPAAAPARIGGDLAPAPCVQVDIAGYRAGHLDCATRALEEAARTAQAQARAGIDLPVAGAGSPDTTVGVASLPGSRLRMGNALGRSVHPDRPSRPAPPPRP